MPNLLTTDGVDTAVANLALAPGTLKAKLVAVLRRQFVAASDQSPDGIPVEALIAELWGLDDREALPSRRKGLSSLKSALNRSLKGLAAQGLNPEGVVIGRTNRFEISEEQKNSLLEKLGVGGQEGGRLAEMFSAFKRAFPELGDERGALGLRELFQRLEQAQGLIAELQTALTEKDRLLAGLGAGAGVDGASVGGKGTELASGVKVLSPADESLTPPASAGETAGGEIVEIEEELLTELVAGPEEEVAALPEAADEALTPTGSAGAESEPGPGPGPIVEIEEELLTELVAGPEGEVAAPPEAAGGAEGGGDAGSAAGTATGGGSLENENPAPPLRLLEVLSKYLDPETAAQEEPEVMLESEEGLVSQLLARFTPKFVGIPAGEYLLGGEAAGCREPLARRIEVKAFYLGQYPVTNDLFDLFVRETGYLTDAEREGYGLVCEGRWRSGRDEATGLVTFTIDPLAALARRTVGANWRHPAGPGSHLEGKHYHPVVQVSRRDALAFAAWAGKRLPSEAEWEAAARGPDGRPYPWGTAWEDGRRGNFASSGQGGTTEVSAHGRAGLSPFGIRDLLGNVHEWVMPALPGEREGFILKGGSWRSEGVIAACHRRVEPVDTWSNTIGFRLSVSWQKSK